MPEPLKSWWRNRKPACGDLPNPYILQHFSGCSVEYASMVGAKAFAIDRILQAERKPVMERCSLASGGGHGCIR